MPTVLITGANRGLGFGFVQEFSKRGWDVIATTRQTNARDAICSIGKNVEFFQLDVSSLSDIQQLESQLQNRPVDILLCNAGIYGDGANQLGQLRDRAAMWEKTFRVNTMAPLWLSEALMPNVAASQHKLIVAISSQMGSIDDNKKGSYYAYRSSKTALNMAIKSLSIDVADQGVTAFVFHPGWVKTDMGGANAPLSIDESVCSMADVMCQANPTLSGQFLKYDGQKINW